MYRLQLFGTPDLVGPEGERSLSILSQRKRLALLAYLTVGTPNGFHSRDTLLGLLWPESDADHARNSLRQSLHFLRRRLGAEAIVSRGEGELGLSRDVLDCDVIAFEAALADGKWEGALDLYGADLLEGFFLSDAPPFERWLEETRARLRRDAVGAALNLHQQASESGDDERACVWARRAVELDPLNELSVRALIEALTRSGDGATAVRVYADFADRLERDYEMEPSPETAAAAEAARQRARSGMAGVPASTSPVASATTSGPSTGGEPFAATEVAAPAATSAARHEGKARAWTRWTTWIPAPIRGKRTAFAPLGLGIVLVITMVATAGIMRPTLSARHLEPLVPRAVAVLPFRNIGSEASDGILAAAVHQEILTRLASVRSLRVIARGSVMNYPLDSEDNRTVAKALGVRYLIRGAIQISDDRVRVWARLVDADSDQQLWSSSYDAERKDLFAIQSEIAGQVTHALETRLPDTRWTGPAPPPTESEEAYELYLRGKLHASRVVNRRDAYEAVRLFNDAVMLDSGFASAYAALSRSSLLLGYLFDEPYWMTQSEAALRRAVMLAPDDGDTWLAEAYYFAYWAQDYDSALDRLARTLAVRPSDADALSLKGFVERRKGQWADAAETMTAALQVDPNSYTTTVVLAEMLMRMREYPRAERLLDRAIAISPGSEAAYGQKALLYLNGSGDTARARAVLEEAPATLSSKYRVLPALTALFRDDPEGALESLRNSESAEGDTARSLDELHLMGLVYRLQGDGARAAAYGDSIGKVIADERRLSEPVHGARGVLRLAESSSYAAIGAALAGNDDEAILQGERAAALLPLASDGYAGSEILERLAEVYALTGRNRDAVQVLGRLLSVPSRITPYVLRLHPAYHDLRADPAFLALLGN